MGSDMYFEYISRFFIGLECTSGLKYAINQSKLIFAYGAI